MQSRISWYKFLLYFVIICPFTSSIVKANDTVYVSNQLINLNKSVSYWVDSSRTATVEQVVAAKEQLFTHQKNFSNAGVITCPLWLSYTLKSNDSTGKIIYLSNPDVRKVTFYVFDQDLNLIKKVATGRSASSVTKDILSRYPGLEINLQKGEIQNLIIKIENRNYPMYFPLQLLNKKEFFELNTNEIIVESIFIGLLCMTLLIVVGIFFWVKRKQFFYYALALFLIITFYASEAGFFVEFDASEWFQDRVKYVTTSMLMVFMTLFIRKAVQFKSKARHLIKVIWGMNVFHIIFATSVLFIPLQTSDWFNPYQMVYFLTVQLYGVLFLMGLFWEARSKNRMAQYGFFAYFFFVITSVTKMMVINGVMGFNWTIFTVLKVGSLVEIGIFNYLIFIQIKAWYDERNKLLIEVNTHQQDLLDALVKGEERERKRLSEELHDSVGSMLSALKLNMPSLKSMKANITDKERYRIEKGFSLLDNTLNEVRSLSHSLQPPDLKNFGLEAELKQYVTRMQTEDFNIYLRFDSWPQIDNQNLCLALFRIVQEGINNTIKHARARNLSIQFRGEEEELILTIEDDGVGFDMNVQQFGIGVKNMKSRISNFPSTFHIESAPGQGTLIIITITDY